MLVCLYVILVLKVKTHQFVDPELRIGGTIQGQLYFFPIFPIFFFAFEYYKNSNDDLVCV
jgi:hypothetical protein